MLCGFISASPLPTVNCHTLCSTNTILGHSWDSLYTTEISNHAFDPSDVGTIWFDDSAAEDKILSYLHSPKLRLDTSSTSFLDIGTGNGHFLFRLRENNDDSDASDYEDAQESQGTFTGRILGTDYSSQSIEFAQRIAQDKGFGPDSENPIEFLHFDIMTSPSQTVLSPPNQDGWEVVLDKGTFDAISLSEETDAQGRKLCEGYKERIVPLVREGGLFLVTSCNWTEEELRAWFDGGELEHEGTIGYKSFSFGGRKGQTISSVSFRKKLKP
jgi:SAM-dependent methyltransferase